MLNEYLDKKYILYTKRGNESIKLALKLAKHLGFHDVNIQDQGGWITYPQFIEKLKLNKRIIKTDFGLASGKFDGVLLINSMPGYFAIQDMSKVSADLVINDVSGSIGSVKPLGDIILGSFGRWKPLNLGRGGFIATDDIDYYNFLKEFGKPKPEGLDAKISALPARLKFLKNRAKDVKNDIVDLDVLHRSHDGLNVIVRYKSDDERESLINYCDENKLDYVECPKYIRVAVSAISIEVKRL